MPLRSRVEKQFGAVIVLPLAGVHRAAAQPDDDRQMLDADRALELARSAGGALERGFLRNVAPSRGSSDSGPNSFRYPRTPSAIFLGSRILCVLNAGQCSVHRPHSTQEYACSATRLREILAGIEAEIVVAGERRNVAEAAARQENRHAG